MDLKRVIVVIPRNNIPEYMQDAFNEAFVTGVKFKAEKYDLPVIAPEALVEKLIVAGLATVSIPVVFPPEVKQPVSVSQYLTEVKNLLTKYGFETVNFATYDEQMEQVRALSDKLGIVEADFHMAMWPLRYNMKIIAPRNEHSFKEKVKGFFSAIRHSKKSLV